MRQLTIPRGGLPAIALTIPDDQPTDYLINEIYSGRCYAPVPCVTDLASVIDIGANVGLAAAYFRACYPDALIHGFEPAPETFAIFAANAERIGRCVAHSWGLYACDRRVNLFLGREGAANNSICQHEYSSTNAISVELKASGRVFSALSLPDSVDIVKIDTEGCEIPVLRGLESWLSRVRLFYIEFHSEGDRRVIDDLLQPTHTLWRAAIHSPHRGLVVYVRRDCLPAVLPDAALVSE
jgi:FkbM family methyltransferase